jgi:hypothetical protein
MNVTQFSDTNASAKKIISSVSGLNDSSTLDAVGVRARDTADRIRMRDREQVVAALKIGSDLLKMEEELGKHLFRTWLQAQCGMKEHQARKYMLLVIHFSDNIRFVPDLPLAVLYKLTTRTTPFSVRRAVDEYLERGKRLAADEIDRLIMEGRRAEERVKKALKRAKKAEQEIEKAEREAKLTPQQRARRDAKIARRRQAGGAQMSKSSGGTGANAVVYCQCSAGQALRKSDGLAKR